jgi:hypothetical protein
MKEYFLWHQEALHNLNSTNWQDYDYYLIIRCLEMDGKCGGGADRLKLPFMVLVPHRLKRLLFYKWERPTDLQAFLVPNAIDCRWSPEVNVTALQNYTFS